MNADLKNIPVTLKFDFNQFLIFFNQLPSEYKKLVVTILEKETTEKEMTSSAWQSLRGSILRYENPFDPATDWQDWEAEQ